MVSKLSNLQRKPMCIMSLDNMVQNWDVRVEFASEAFNLTAGKKLLTADS